MQILFSMQHKLAKIINPKVRQDPAQVNLPSGYKKKTFTKTKKETFKPTIYYPNGRKD